MVRPILLALSVLVVIVTAFLPWIYVGPVYVTGWQGDGMLSALGAAVALLAAVLLLARRKTSTAAGWTALVSGFVALAVSVANVGRVIVRTLFNASISVVQLTHDGAAMTEQASRGASRLAESIVTLPADIFVIMVRKNHIPAFVEGIEGPASLEDVSRALENLSALPSVGVGLTLSTLASLLALIIAVSITASATRSARGRKTP